MIIIIIIKRKPSILNAKYKFKYLSIVTSHTHCVYKPGALPQCNLKKQKPPGTNFTCVATSSPRFLPASDSEWPHHLSQRRRRGANIALSLNASTCFVLSLGRHRRAKRKHRWHCTCFREVSSLPRFQTTGNGRVHKLLGTSMKANFFSGRTGAQCIRPCCWGRESSISQPDEWQITSASWAHLTAENYERRVKD